MKNVFKIFIVSIMLAFLVMACGATGTKEAAKTDGDSKSNVPSKENTSYAFGIAIGTSLKETGVEIDYKKFLDGVKEAIEKDDHKMTMEEVQDILQTAISDAAQKRSAKNVEEEKAFVASNGKKSTVKTTSSGVQYEVIKEGTGAKPKDTDTVKINYVGTFIDGKEFDSSVKAGTPATFPVNGVIPGLAEGIQLMTVGSKYKFYIPSALAYGPQGAGSIGPNKMIIFEVELLSIEEASTNH